VKQSQAFKSYLRRGTLHSVACVNLEVHPEEIVGMELLQEMEPKATEPDPFTTITVNGVLVPTNPSSLIFLCPRCKRSSVVFLAKEPPKGSA
jgi:hypothetical protein